MISAIWAMDKNWLVGNGDKLPWRIKEDLQYFKEKAKGKTVLMGDTTYFSLKGYYKDKPLPFGKIYVATLDEELVIPDVILIHDLVEFINDTGEEILIIGGSTIYQLTLPYVNTLYITHINKAFNGDTYMKKTDEFDKFTKVDSNIIKTSEGIELEFATYNRT